MESSTDASSNQLTSQVPAQSQTREELPPHPLINLTFPPINDDGSISDLTAHQSRHRPYPPTPPAALSSLGARATMEDNNQTKSESGGSFADSQYDMIDDLSEMSDDHETASIASNDDPSGQLTPEYAQSETDEIEEVEHEQPDLLDHNEEATLSASAESFIALPSPTSTVPDKMTHQTKAENDLIDSYTSEDLETPRQSTMPATFASTYHLSQRKSADRAMRAAQVHSAANHILFVSDRDMPVEDMDGICARVAACLDPISSTAAASEFKVKRLPATPSGVLTSATVMRGRDSASATIQHCIGAERRDGDSYQLLVLDSDEEHSSFFTVGPHGKIDLQKPRLAVFYLDTYTYGMAWFDIAWNAVRYLNVPILVIRDSDCAAADDATIGYGEGESQLTLDSKHFAGMNRSELTTSIAQLIGEHLPLARPGLISRFKASSKTKWAENSKYFTFGLMLLTFMLPFLALAHARHLPNSHPEADLAIRREALNFALDKFSTSANVTKVFNIEHLVPEPQSNCTQTTYFGLPLGVPSCTVQAHFQNAPPNHVIVSLLNGPRQPRLDSVHAYRNDGRVLNATQNKLMAGVYHIALDPNEAYGIVNFNVITSGPLHNITWTNNFGNRLLQRQTYQKASTDISKIVGKDVAVVKHAAKGITGKMTTEIGAGLSATKNVTSQLALYVTRDIMLVADTAVSVFANAARAGNKTVSDLGKDLALVQKDVTNFGQSCSKSFKSTMESAKANSMALIRAPLDMTKQRLALSRERMQALKHALQRPSAKKTTVPRKSSSLEKFEQSLAATPEHELSSKQKVMEQARQFTANYKALFRRGQGVKGSVQHEKLRKELSGRKGELKKRMEKIREQADALSAARAQVGGARQA